MYNNRLCPLCSRTLDNGEVEGEMELEHEQHFLSSCSFHAATRQHMYNKIINYFPLRLTFEIFCNNLDLFYFGSCLELNLMHWQ